MRGPILAAVCCSRCRIIATSVEPISWLLHIGRKPDNSLGYWHSRILRYHVHTSALKEGLREKSPPSPPV